MEMGSIVVALMIAALVVPAIVNGAELTPPYFNLAEGRKIYSTSTCGVDTDGPELYCKLAGKDQEETCDSCDTADPAKSHLPENAIDDTENWWQSPPLSRGMNYNKVNLTIDFGNEFLMKNVLIDFGNSPRPSVLSIEKSTDYGESWMALQHFAETKVDCEKYFNEKSLQNSSTNDSSSFCTTEYSKKNSSANEEISVDFKDWIKATNLRIRFLKTLNLSDEEKDQKVLRQHYYSVKKISIDGRCACNLDGALEGDSCDTKSGICRCKDVVVGKYCDKCHTGFYNFPECSPCDCDFIGSENPFCNENGQCLCREKFTGRRCNECQPGYYSENHIISSCIECDCEKMGTDDVCDRASGKCVCREGYGGSRCDECVAGYFNYPDCKPCNCSTHGSKSASCDKDGKCSCLDHFEGLKCSSCDSEHYNYPECLACNCSAVGSSGTTCSPDGQCSCFDKFSSRACNQCGEGLFDYPICEECSCNEAGTVPDFAGCGSMPSGKLCECKERVTGRYCDTCKPLYWNFNESNPEGCEECNCFTDGTAGATGTCDIKTGQCACKSTVQGRTCDVCKDGMYAMKAGSLFPCKDCECNPGGSVNGVCNKTSGQCECLPGVTGIKCDRTVPNYYFPNLHQFHFEYEDGKRPDGQAIRYEFEERIFPNFSSKGYIVLSDKQPEVWNEVNIVRASNYRLVIRYMSHFHEEFEGKLLIQHANSTENEAVIVFKPAQRPDFVTYYELCCNDPEDVLALEPGRYIFKMQVKNKVFLDYFALLPAPFYTGSILTRKLIRPCGFKDKNTPNTKNSCTYYNYPHLKDFTSLEQLDRSSGELLWFSEVEDYSSENDVALLNEEQPKLYYKLSGDKSTKYVIVVDYITDTTFTGSGVANVTIDKDNDGVLTYNPCPFITPCRLAVLDGRSRVKTIDLDEDGARTLILYATGKKNLGIVSVTAIPLDSWSSDYLIPKEVCVPIRDPEQETEECVRRSYESVQDAKKIEIEDSYTDLTAKQFPPYVTDVYDEITLVYLPVDKGFSLNLLSDVEKPDRYFILLHYYQPNRPSFEMTYSLEIDQQVHNGRLRVHHCPSNIGCRVLIGKDVFYIKDSINLTLTKEMDSNDIWLDFVLLVPMEKFNENLLSQEAYSQAQEFINECSEASLYVDQASSDLCKKAAFAITVNYNQGALPCGCNAEGSEGSECSPFSGKCKCKPNIVGRQCDTCAKGYTGFPDCVPCERGSENCGCALGFQSPTCDACSHGYFGYPDCKPCNCSSERRAFDYCDTDTGSCNCKANFTGYNCDSCSKYYYAYPQCSECECFRPGSRPGCNDEGICQCVGQYTGKHCKECKVGYYGFSSCYACDCDPKFTTSEICSKDTGECFCREGYSGRHCLLCAMGYYNFPNCTPCNCSSEGSMANFCNDSGQCPCLPNYGGLDCSKKLG
ncbi:laminin subunit alpha-like [Lutzomyia longipalpis]|uniref:laminin subunit alpha-like n=1 Tax=Lutzomyia longipalpis TaxID=7200 RepID=UPI002483CF62|nr:laminin subunit alpha-like [Lutzomyia longipalpis]